MKKIPYLLLGIVLLTGCMHHYDITLVNGMRMTHVSKPKLNKDTGMYEFKDIKGRARTVQATRVLEIGPHTSKVRPGSTP